MAPFSFPSDLGAIIREEFPSSIAVPFADLETELAAGSPSAMKIFSRMIDLYEISVTTAALASVASMIANRAPISGNFARVIRELRENSKLSTGFWWELLRETLSAAFESGEQGFAGELASLYYSKKGKVSENASMLDAIPGLRNKAKGHSWTMPEEKYGEYAASYLPALANWLGMLLVFRRYTMVSPQAVLPGEGESRWDILLLAGNRIKPQVRQFRCTEQLRINAVFLVRSEVLQGDTLCEQPPVPLSPLFTLRKTAGMVQELFLYQGGDGKKAVYSGSISSERIESADEAQNAVNFLSAGSVQSSFSVRAERMLAPLRDSAAECTGSWVKRMRDLHIYDPATCVERKKARNHIEAFLGSGLPAVLLTGSSGTGKTSFIASIASSWLESRPAEKVFAVLPAEGIPANGRELSSWLSARLCQGRPFAEWAAQLEDILSKREKFQCVIVVEGMDRHADPLSLMAGFIDIASKLRLSRVFRFIGSTTPSLPAAFERAGGHFDAAVFYSPSFGLGSGEGSAGSGISIGLLSPDELQAAFAAYAAQPEGSVGTKYEELSEDMAASLSHPLILRMAMEVYRGQPLPRRVFGPEMLKEYAAKRVFVSPQRLDFAAELVEEMLVRKSRSLPFESVRKNPSLRGALLDSSSSSVVTGLSEDQVLTLRPAAAGDLPFPPSFMLEFTFDRVLEYLIFWRISAEGSAASFAALLRDAKEFPSLRGALLLWGGHCVRRGQIAQLLSLYDDADRGLVNAFLSDIISEQADAADEKKGQSHFSNFLSVLGTRDVERTLHLASHSAQALFVQGNWDGAHRILSAAVGLPADRFLLVRERNRLVLLEKNMDRWNEALADSDICLKEAGENAPADLAARILINRSSVVYDLGPRSSVPGMLDRAADAAKGEEFLLAAVHNNGALYRLYHDECEAAAEAFRRAISLPGVPALQKAYLENNLGLALLSLSLADGSHAVEARQCAENSLAAFRKAGHIQGISYAASNRGLHYLAQQMYDEAEACFGETRTIAHRIGEKWTAYGSLVNSACVLLERPDGDREKALSLGLEAIASARENGDKKGIGDAGLVAAKASMVLRSQGYSVPCDPAAVLEEARAAFAALDQRLGQACAAWGLMELDQSWNGCDPAALLRGTSYEQMTPGLRALPWQMFLLMEVF